MLLENTIHLGDCLELMKEIPDASVDMVLCDLPYGTTSCKWDAVIPFNALWKQYLRVAKEKAAIVLTAAQPFSTTLIASNLKDFKYSWVWVKTNCTGFANAKKQPLRCYEDVCVFCKKSPNYYPQGLIRLTEPKMRTKKTGDFMGRNGFKDGYAQEWTNYPKNVLNIASEKNTDHPTQKPVALMEYLIKTYTNPGELVLDNCAGSGTTAVACKQTGRRFICIEKDEDYWHKACERLDFLDLEK